MDLVLKACFVLMCLGLFAGDIHATAADATSYLVYIGTYTDKDSKGIYAFRIGARTGDTQPLGLVAETVNPSFLGVDPGANHLYAVNEIDEFKGQKTGAVSAFKIDKTSGKLTLLNQVPTGGTGPAYVLTDRTGKYVLVANYAGGSVAVLPVSQDGSLGKVVSLVQHHGSGPKPNQSMPRAHSISMSADNRFAVVADLALDELISYPFDAKTGLLNPNDARILKLPPGVGPRHSAFHPALDVLYVITEMESTVSAVAFDRADGSLRLLQTVSALPNGFHGVNNAAEIQVHPSGKFLFASNRGADTIAVFAIDANTGMLKLIENFPAGGREPRQFGMDATGHYMIIANQNSNQVAVFRIDSKTGHLTPTGQTFAVPSPVAVRFVPAQ